MCMVFIKFINCSLQFYAVFSNSIQRLLNTNNSNNNTQIITTLRVTQISNTPVTGENQRQYNA